MITIVSRWNFPRFPKPSGLPESEDNKAVFTVSSSSAKPPVLLAVNFESRNVALQRYELRFGSLLGKKPVYFAAELDILQLHALESNIMGLFQNGWIGQRKEQEEELNAVKSAIHQMDFHEPWVRHWPFARALSRHVNLESITMLDRGRSGLRPPISLADQAARRREFDAWWKQLRGIDAKVPALLFVSREAMKDKLKVTLPYS